jgi:hypothetical protein
MNRPIAGATSEVSLAVAPGSDESQTESRPPGERLLAARVSLRREVDFWRTRLIMLSLNGSRLVHARRLL